MTQVGEWPGFGPPPKHHARLSPALARLAVFENDTSFLAAERIDPT